jgi:hypothetical protein
VLGDAFFLRLSVIIVHHARRAIRHLFRDDPSPSSPSRPRRGIL